jgi:hypothetical protein
MTLVTRVSEREYGCCRLGIPASSWIPAFATDEVASVPPGHGVLASLAHGVSGITAAVRPPRVEVAIVVAFTVGRNGTSQNDSGGVAVVPLSDGFQGGGQGRGGSCSSKKKRLEGDHGVLSSTET